MKIEIPEELFNVREYDSTEELIEDMTSRNKEIRLRLTEGEEITLSLASIYN